MGNRFAFVLLFALAIFVSCSKEESPPSSGPYNYYYNYLPLELGNFWVYKVDSIVYDDFSFPVSVDSFHYYVKHEIIDMEFGLDGFPVYEVLSSIRNDSISNWKMDYVFNFRKTERELVRNADNLPTVIMVFPVRETEWNGNAYNTQGEKTFVYEDVHQPDLVDSVFYENTVKVVHHRLKNLLQDEFKMQQYASKVGMVFKEERFLQTNFQAQIQSGHELKYRLILTNFQ